MTDSPAYKVPLDAREQPILDKLLVVRDKLCLLKSDKSNYVRSGDVINHYNSLLELVQDVTEVRKDRPNAQNRLDRVLDDCFQLISLFFMTIGRNNEAPAAYSIVSTVQRLLNHLKEAGFYTMKDINGIANQLAKVKASVELGHGTHDKYMLLQLQSRIENCEMTLIELKRAFSHMCDELVPVHEKLVSILRSISGASTKKKFPEAEVKEYQRELKDIREKLHVDRPDTPSNQTIEEQYEEKLRQINYDSGRPGKTVVLDLLDRCTLWSEICLQRRGRIDERFKDKFSSLLAIRTHLDRLSLTQAWSLRETDLYSYQRQLDRHDEARIDGNFYDSEGKPAELYEQRALLYLLRKSYASIFMMIVSSEPVSEALVPIYNQLLTLRTCLNEVKRSGGVSSPRELYPYSMKLNSIDNMREDGKFVVNGDTPEGQGAVVMLLSECFDLAYDLRNEAEKQENSGDDDSDLDQVAMLASKKAAGISNVDGVNGAAAATSIGVN